MFRLPNDVQAVKLEKGKFELQRLAIKDGMLQLKKVDVEDVVRLEVCRCVYLH